MRTTSVSAKPTNSQSRGRDLINAPPDLDRISRHTVHSHAKKIYDKLHARGRTQAIRKAKLSGLLDPAQ